MKVGVLAVQGAFLEHEQILRELGADYVELRKQSDISDIDGLILPGGESTVQGKLMKELEMFEPLKSKIEDGIPVLATCAGLILLSRNIVNDDNKYFGTLPVSIRRNAYGRQLGSFRTKQPLKGFGEFDMTFIRAPYIEAVDEGVDVLAEVDNQIIAVQYKNQIGLSFHPELGGDYRIHQYFLDMISSGGLSH